MNQLIQSSRKARNNAPFVTQPFIDLIWAAYALIVNSICFLFSGICILLAGGGIAMVVSILFTAFSGIAMIISFLQLYNLLPKKEFYDFIDALDNFLEGESLTKKDITQIIYNDDGIITVVLGEGENKREVTCKKD